MTMMFIRSISGDRKEGRQDGCLEAGWEGGVGARRFFSEFRVMCKPIKNNLTPIQIICLCSVFEITRVNLQQV